MTEKIIDLTNDSEMITTEMEIEVEETVGWTSGGGTVHNDLTGREWSDQHPIKSIIGLKDKLEEEKTLKTVYSDKVGVANYYKWDSGAYDDYGYFVSLASANTISICNGTDIFGVTVDSAAFVGGQIETIIEETDEYGMPKHLYATDNTYALVATSGQVAVRCASDVVAGKYVVANEDGIAVLTESGCGYKVSATSYKETPSGKVLFAIISLGVQACTTDILGQRVTQLETDMVDAEINIATAMRLANEACSMAGTSNTTSGETKETIDNVVEVVDRIQGEIDSTRADLDKSKADASESILKAEAISNKAMTVANGALTNINDLVEKLEPIDEWVDPETGKVGAEYVIKYMDENGLSTKAEVQVVESLTEDNKSAIEHNASSINMMVSSVDKYSIGEYSQAYGLTLEQARSILKDGMIYIPTKHGNVETHTETYIYNETEKLEKDFTEGYYYIWSTQPDGEFMWGERIGKVWVNKEQPEGDAYTYWYDGNKLCLLNDGKWVEVATLAGNVSNRTISQIRQDANSIAFDVTNVKGDLAGIKIWAGDDFAAIQDTVTWKNDNDEAIATTMQKASDSEAYIAQIASVKNEDGTINATASIVTAVIEDEGSIALLADNINLTGYVKMTDLSGEGTTEINGANITTGILQSKEYDYESGVYAVNGTAIDLDTGYVRSKNFAIDESGNAYFNGALSSDVIKSNNYPHTTRDANGNVIGPLVENDGDIPYSTNGTFLNLEDGSIYSPHFVIKPDGATYFDGTLSANTLSTIEITASNITTGTLQSKSYSYSDEGLPFAEGGTAFDLDRGIIRSKNFAIEEDGVAHIKGEITAFTGKIGPLAIDEKGLSFDKVWNHYSADDFTSSANQSYYIYELSDGEYMFSTTQHTDKKFAMTSVYTSRFKGTLKDIPYIKFYYNDTEYGYIGIGVWPVKNGIIESSFSHFKLFGNFYGDIIDTTIDTSDITDEFYVCFFVSYAPTSDVLQWVELSWPEKKASLSANGYMGVVIPTEKNWGTLRELYIDERGRLCVKPQN